MSLQSSHATADEMPVGGGFMTYWSSSVVYVALLPIFVASHELGHAAVILARSPARVSIGLGRRPGSWRICRGRIDLTIGLNFWSYKKPAGTVAYVPLDTRSTVACALAGPIAQAAASSLLIPVGVATHHARIGDAGILGIVFALISLVPFRLRGHDTDGAKLLMHLRRKDGRKIDRWIALYRDLDGTLGRERGRVLDAVPHLVEHPGKGPDALAVWRLAFAGWCWRAVQGDSASEMREAALDAIQAATLTGAAEPDLTIIAAQSLAARAPASGFELLRRQLTSIPVDEGKQRWSFQFGVAFYDIERARGSAV
jgi:hypothetical protein